MEQNRAALSVWELLEHMLFNLDMRTLLVSQRVCGLWYTVINRSKRLQQKLFFLPIDPFTNPRVRNPLLEEVFWSQAADPFQSKYGCIYEHETGPMTKHSIHHATASWRRMLIQQPPTSTIGVINCFTLHGNKGIAHCENFLVAPDNDYLRLGALYNPLTTGDMSVCLKSWAFWGNVDKRHWVGGCLQEGFDKLLGEVLENCDVVVWAYDSSDPFRVVRTGLKVWRDRLPKIQSGECCYTLEEFLF